MPPSLRTVQRRDRRDPPEAELFDRSLKGPMPGVTGASNTKGLSMGPPVFYDLGFPLEQAGCSSLAPSPISTLFILTPSQPPIPHWLIGPCNL